jgi:hypothetical protein
MPVSPVSNINADARAEAARAVAQQLESSRAADRGREDQAKVDSPAARSGADITGAVVNKSA